MMKIILKSFSYHVIRLFSYYVIIFEIRIFSRPLPWFSESQTPVQTGGLETMYVCVFLYIGYCLFIDLDSIMSSH